MENQAPTEPLTTEAIEEELEACASSKAYFAHHYCQIYDSVTKSWIPFRLWREQADYLDLIQGPDQFFCVLKARQLGWTWLEAADSAHDMIFSPISTILMFSRGDAEAVELLRFRLTGMLQRLPAWMRPEFTSNAHEITMANGSRAMSFPTTGGRSYTATKAIVDEADRLPASTRKAGLLGEVLAAVQPTIDAGGKLVLISTVDKKKPQSLFKEIYRAAKAGKNNYVPVFHGWRVRPDRTQEWYDAICKAAVAQEGSLDTVYAEYPATDTEALAPVILDKRLAPTWLERCYRAMPPGEPDLTAPSIPGLVVYAPPFEDKTTHARKRYIIGADPAQGNPTSDDSAITVLEVGSGEEVAAVRGKIEPAVFASYIDKLGRWYFDAPVMVEKNNHGHAVILWLQANSQLQLLNGPDENVGWTTTAKSKAILYDNAADAFRNGETIIHSFAAWSQLCSIEGNTLSAPEGMMDDIAMSYVLALAGLKQAAAWGDFSATMTAAEPSLMAGAPSETGRGGECMRDRIERMGW